MPIYIVLHKWSWAGGIAVLLAVTSVFMKFNWYDKLEKANAGGRVPGPKCRGHRGGADARIVAPATAGLSGARFSIRKPITHALRTL